MCVQTVAPLGSGDISSAEKEKRPYIFAPVACHMSAECEFYSKLVGRPMFPWRKLQRDSVCYW
jgi:hypothetical protein